MPNEIESNEIESNEIESNEIESNEIESNEIESNEIESNEMTTKDFIFMLLIAIYGNIFILGIILFSIGCKDFTNPSCGYNKGKCIASNYNISESYCNNQMFLDCYTLNLTCKNLCNSSISGIGSYSSGYNKFQELISGDASVYYKNDICEFDDRQIYLNKLGIIFIYTFIGITLFIIITELILCKIRKNSINYTIRLNY